MTSKIIRESDVVSPTKESDINAFSFNPIYLARRKASQKLKRKSKDLRSSKQKINKFFKG